MALAKDGYKSAILMTAKMGVNTNSDGNIAMGDETSAGTATLSITRANAENTLDSNVALFNTLVGFVSGSIVTSTSKATVTWSVG